MIPASRDAEAAQFQQSLRNQDALSFTRERRATSEHVALHYRPIALPALAAAARHTSHLHKRRQATATG